MGQAKTGEPKRAARQRGRRDRASTADRSGVQVRAVRDRGIEPGKAGGLPAGRPAWLIAEQERRRAQIGPEAEGRPRRELAGALVASVDEVRLQELKHAVSDAVDARWAPEAVGAKRKARQLAGQLLRWAGDGGG